MNRRQWLRTAGGILAAPAVVRAESIMRVRPVVVAPTFDEITREALRVLSEKILPTTTSIMGAFDFRPGEIVTFTTGPRAEESYRVASVNRYGTATLARVLP